MVDAATSVIFRLHLVLLGFLHRRSHVRFIRLRLSHVRARVYVFVCGL